MNGDVSQKRFASGVTALTLSVAAVKLIGMIYKIPLFGLLGAEGMGYFGAAYELYALFFVISSAGLPVAVSMMISERLSESAGASLRVHRISFSVFAVLGIFGTLVMAFGAGGFSRFLGNEKAMLSILAVAPAIFFVCISGAMRGLFQGYGNMRPTAVSQVIEAVCKLAFGIGFAFLARQLGFGAEKAAAMAALGLTVGTGISMLYLLILGRRMYVETAKKRSCESGRSILKKLILLAVPVTLSASLSGLGRVADMGLILGRLQSAGHTAAETASLYGCYSTMALPVYNLPASFMTGISLSLIPMLTAAVAERDRERASALSQNALGFCLFLAFPASVGMALFASPLLALIFSGQTEAVAASAPMLTALAFSVVSSCLLGVTTSVLQAYGKVSIPIFSMLLGTAVKMSASYILMGIPEVGIYAIPIGTWICNTLAVGLQLYAIDRYTDLSLGVFRMSAAPMTAAFLAVSPCRFLWQRVSGGAVNAPQVLFFVACCVVGYCVLGGRFGAFCERELRMFPGGERLATLLVWLRIIKKQEDIKRKDKKYEYERGYHKSTS